MKMKKKKYTVLLAYPEDVAAYNAESFMAWTQVGASRKREAEVVEAIDHARNQCIKINGSGEFGEPPGSELEPIAVIEGWHKDVKP